MYKHNGEKLHLYRSYAISLYKNGLCVYKIVKIKIEALQS